MSRIVFAVLLLQHFEVISDCGGPLAAPVKDAPASQLAMGGGFGCAVDDGAVRCWGENTLGQLGRGTTSAFETGEAAVRLDEQVAQLAVGQTSACARTVTGRVWCWGDNANSQLGRADPAISAAPLEVNVPVPVAKLALHSDFALALGSDGRLFGWGNDSEGTLGRSDENPKVWPVPKPVLRAAFDHRFKDVSAGQGHACGVDLAGVLWCWGRNTAQELGTPSTEHQHRAPIEVLRGVSAVVAGAFSTCAVRGTELLCWGDTPIDELGQVIKSTSPLAVDLGGAAVRSVDQQWFHTCAVTTADQLFCWGRGAEGQLGLGDNTAHATPQLVTSGVGSVATGFFFTCLRRTDGTVSCMGANEAAQLGLGDTQRRAVPTPQ